MSKTKSRGFTLMELLIAVSIFSGLVILALGSFARSISSSAKVSSVRERTEVTRSIINQISNDLRYTYKQNVTVGSGATQYTIVKGIYSDPNGTTSSSLELILDYPNSSDIVYKKYFYESPRRGGTLKMLEDRTSCTKATNTCALINAAQSSDLLPEKYILLTPTSSDPLFTVLMPTIYTRGLVTIDFSFTLADSGVTKITECSSSTSGIGGRCYSLKTSVVPGGY